MSSCVKFNQEHANFLYKLNRYDTFFNLSDVLANNKIKNVAIFGAASLGTLLYEKLYGSTISVKYIIDDIQPEFKYDIDIYKLNEINPSIDIDAVIITPLDEAVYYTICETLRTVFSDTIKMISLDALVIDVDIYNDFANTLEVIKRKKSRLSIVDTSKSMLWGLRNPSQHEQTMKLTPQYWYNVYFKAPNMAKTLDFLYNDIEDYTEEYITGVFDIRSLPMYYINEPDKKAYIGDFTSEYYNFVNNERITYNTPDTYDKHIYIFGNCIAFGFFTDDSRTIASKLQLTLNESVSKYTYRVHNNSIVPQISDTLRYITDAEIADDSTIFIFLHDVINFAYYFPEDSCLSYISLADSFSRPHHYGEVFIDPSPHVNHRGYEIIANTLHQAILCHEEARHIERQPSESRNLAPSLPPLRRCLHPKGNELSTHASLNEYLRQLKQFMPAFDGTFGSIVMNCNPFTLGHRFLIEQAASQCDYLYIFLVEEDKSYFSFQDRLEMLRAGTGDIGNIALIPSGKFIISSLTFPDYFQKSDIKDKGINPSQDIELFATRIAPELGIVKRFAGTEPSCHVTQQYNQAMSKILPKNGIEFIEIERKCTADGKVVSASEVRKRLEESKSIDDLTPLSTREYLQTIVRRKQG